MLHCLGKHFHQWSRNFWDQVAKEEYQRCMMCGRRRRAPLQISISLREEAEFRNEARRAEQAWEKA